MKIKILSTEALQTLKANLDTDIRKYGNADASELLAQLNDNALINTGIVCDDFNLIQSNDPYVDIANVKKVYSSLKSVLSPSIGADERLWAGLSMSGENWGYINKRWKRGGWTAQSIKDHFYFGGSDRRSLTRNALARLFWIGKLTYDENDKDDPWKYTKYICSHQRFISDILERNTSNSKPLLFACMDACLQYTTDNPGKKIDSNQMREIQKYMSILGGTYALDTLSSEMLKNKIYASIADMDKQI